MSNERLAAQIAALSDAFVAELPERIRRLEEALQRLDKDETAARAALLIVHSLSGAGATFGCPEVSAAARGLEEAVFRPGAGGCLDPATRGRIPRLMTALKSAADIALARRSDTEAP